MSNSRTKIENTPLSMSLELVLTNFSVREVETFYCLTTPTLAPALIERQPELKIVTDQKSIESTFNGKQFPLFFVHGDERENVDENIILFLLNHIKPCSIIYNPKNYSSQVTYHEHAKARTIIIVNNNTNAVPIHSKKYLLTDCDPRVVAQLSHAENIILNRFTPRKVIEAIPPLSMTSWISILEDNDNLDKLSNRTINLMNMLSPQTFHVLQDQDKAHRFGFAIRIKDKLQLEIISALGNNLIILLTSQLRVKELQVLQDKNHKFYLSFICKQMLEIMKPLSNIVLAAFTPIDALTELVSSNKRFNFYIFHPIPQLLNVLKNNSIMVITSFATETDVVALRGKGHIFYMQDPNPEILKSFEKNAIIVFDKNTSTQVLKRFCELQLKNGFQFQIDFCDGVRADRYQTVYDEVLASLNPPVPNNQSPVTVVTNPTLSSHLNNSISAAYFPSSSSTSHIPHAETTAPSMLHAINANSNSSTTLTLLPRVIPAIEIRAQLSTPPDSSLPQISNNGIFASDDSAFNHKRKRAEGEGINIIIGPKQTNPQDQVKEPSSKKPRPY